MNHRLLIPLLAAVVLLQGSWAHAQGEGAPPTSAPSSQPTTGDHQLPPPPSVQPPPPPPAVQPPPPLPRHPPPLPPRKVRGTPPPRQPARPAKPLFHELRSRIFFLGIGFSLGFFAPPDVNTYLEGWQDSQGLIVSESGFPGMYVNLVPRIAVTLRPMKYIKIKAIAEVGWGPKVISSNIDSEVFSFLRISPGVVGTFHLPLGNKGRSLFAGVGFVYHWMSFEDFSADAPGFHGELGFEVFTSKMLIEILVAVDYARGDAGQPIGFGNPDSMILNYTGVTFGVNMHFGLF